MEYSEVTNNYIMHDGDVNRHYRALQMCLTENDREKYVIFDSVSAGDMVIAAVSGAHRGIPQKEGCERRVIVTSFDPVQT